ncbi:MAG: hypothetical protein ACXW11_06100 [Methylotenera sp.]
MDKNMFMQNAIPAALFVALEGLYAISAMAGDGVVVLQREVPVRPEFHDEAPGHATSHATSLDVSPDDKVVQAVNSQRSNLKPTELGDAACGATGNIGGTVDGVTGTLALNGLPAAIMRSSGQ